MVYCGLGRSLLVDARTHRSYHPLRVRTLPDRTADHDPTCVRFDGVLDVPERLEFGPIRWSAQYRDRNRRPVYEITEPRGVARVRNLEDVRAEFPPDAGGVVDGGLVGRQFVGDPSPHTTGSTIRGIPPSRSRS